MKTGSRGVQPEEPEEGAEELLLLARKLESLGEGPMLTKDTEDRIFAKIEETLDQELAPRAVHQPTRVRERVAALGAFLPRPLVQRRADALAMMIEDVKAGRQVKATGEFKSMIAAAAAMSPIPAIEPDPSFVNWLEVRLAHAEAPEKARIARRIAAFNGMLRNWRLQAGLASAAASVIAMAIFALQGFQTVTEPAPVGPVAAPPVVVDEVPPVQEPTQVAQATGGARVPLSRTSADSKGTPGGGSSGGGGTVSEQPPQTESGGSPFSSAGMPEDGPKRMVQRMLSGLNPEE